MASEDVIINIIVKTNQAANAMRNIGTDIRTMGEKITGIGMRISAAFTLPLVALFTALGKNEAFSSAFQPIQDAFSGVFNQIATGLIPLLNELKPDLLGLAADLGGLFKSFLPALQDMLPTIKQLLDYVREAVTWFSNLGEPTKDAIVKFVLFGAILGPVLVGIGQLIWLGGTLISVLPDLAAGLWTTVAPVMALAAAIYAIYKLVNMDEFKKLAALVAGGAAGWTTGSKEYAAMVTASTYASMGGGQAGGEDTANYVRGILGGVQAPSGGAGNMT